MFRDNARELCGETSSLNSNFNAAWSIIPHDFAKTKLQSYDFLMLLHK